MNSQNDCQTGDGAETLLVLQQRNAQPQRERTRPAKPTDSETNATLLQSQRQDEVTLHVRQHQFPAAVGWHLAREQI
mgnify:FL=1